MSLVQQHPDAENIAGIVEFMVDEIKSEVAELADAEIKPEPEETENNEDFGDETDLEELENTGETADADEVKPNITVNGSYNYSEDENLFTIDDIPIPFEDVRPFEDGVAQRTLVLDQMAKAFDVLQSEAKRIQGHLRALNARSGRIRKQIEREEDAIQNGLDPTSVPRSSKGLVGNSVVTKKRKATTTKQRVTTKKMKAEKVEPKADPELENRLSSGVTSSGRKIKFPSYYEPSN